MGRQSFMVMGLLAATATASPYPHLAIPKRQEDTPKPTPKGQTFADIKPSPELSWVDCYTEKWQCAYLTVPLDYADPSVGTTDIAFIRYLLSEDAEDLLFNPGGPGGSGVEAIIDSDFSGDTGEKWSKQWGVNMVSFDPRGVGWSGPKVTCAPGNNTALEARTTVDEFRKAFEAQAKINHACNEANKDTDAKYVGTSAVVQDMMHFVELQAAAKGKKPEEALINYYGISYGTVVGQTLAQMYPDRLRRVLLDANVNSVGHYQGWEPSGLDDLAHSIWMFSNFCFEAGPEWCALAEGKSSTKEIQYRFDRVLAQLENEPLITSKFPVGRVEFFTAAQQLLYHPRNDEGYNKLINLTIAAETRDVAAMEEVLGKALKGLSRRETPTPSGHEQRIITAVDIAGRYPWKNFEDWFAAVERIEAPYGGPNYAVGNGLIGFGMDSFVPPPSQFVDEFKLVNTSVPVLFVNTAGDPVTPRSSVHQMSKLFGGSSWFIQNSPGHAINNSKSKCTDDILLAYFKDGTVPEEDTWCEPDVEAKWYFGFGEK